MSMVFLYKEKTESRDCFAYIEDEAMRFQGDHYFASINLHGACYSKSSFAPYADIETILSESEYNRLRVFSMEIKSLGYGIKKGDDRYNMGVALCKEIQPIFDKLMSEENMKFFKALQEKEKLYLMDAYDFSEENVKQIFDEYSLEYKDRAVVACVFENAYDYGYDEIRSYNYYGSERFEEDLMEYFDFERFGHDLVKDYKNGIDIELEDGRIAVLNYQIKVNVYL